MWYCLGQYSDGSGQYGLIWLSLVKYTVKEGPTEMGKVIAIIFAEHLKKKMVQHYRIWRFAEFWEQCGYKINFIFRYDEPVDADLIIPHNNLSVRPEEVYQMFADTSAVINRDVCDIRKSCFSTNLVNREDDYQGPVIVKTDANYGGLPERVALKYLPGRERLAAQLVRSKRAWKKIYSARSFNSLVYRSRISPSRYPVFSSKSQLPQGTFTNKELIVEKFLPEKDGEYYCLRSYAFLGDKGVAVRSKSKYPVVKGANGFDLEFIPIDEQIVEWQKKLGFDYGKFDYVVRDGEVVLFDVNDTPTFGNAYSEEVQERIVNQLAGGITRWLPIGGK